MSKVLEPLQDTYCAYKKVLYPGPSCEMRQPGFCEVEQGGIGDVVFVLASPTVEGCYKIHPSADICT